ncbi:unnamed protein product [Oppiella nova]|uniref:BAT2 N-terminal domain-containing protein n=1 Tax=Oppiella nova TaxID=334625 RepID=A0A7R9M652_9ACAR|nr:unnamed protein product [Oppiella nova]CAG2170186.1 unnamed protein product [Oppiella nova]
MSAVSGLTSKGENKSKQKYQSLNINNLYKGKSLETTKTSVAPKHGLQTLGKVGAGRRMPPPANLPSLKSQTTTTPNITLVPTGGQGWGSGKEEDSGATPPLQTSSSGVDATPLSAQKPSAGPLNPLTTSSTATTDTSVGAIALGLTSAALTAQSKTWSTVTATAEHPESGPDKSYLAQQSPFFPQEFPIVLTMKRKFLLMDLHLESRDPNSVCCHTIPPVPQVRPPTHSCIACLCIRSQCRPTAGEWVVPTIGANNI